jgi:hypothetical protein
MKFGMDFMPLGTTLKSYFSITYNGKRSKVIAGRHCCGKINWTDICARKASDATMNLDHMCKNELRNVA